MITTEQILSIDGSRIITTGGVRRAAGNALHRIGETVTVCGDLVMGWHRPTGSIPAPWPVETDYRFADADGLMMYSVSNDFADITDIAAIDLPVVGGNPVTGAALALHCYNADNEFLLWFVDNGANPCRAILENNGTVIADFTTVFRFVEWGMTVDGYINDGDLVWSVASVDGSDYLVMAQYTNAILADSCSDIISRIGSDAVALAEIAQYAANGINYNMTVLDTGGTDVGLHPTYGMPDYSDEIHHGGGGTTLTLSHHPISAINLITLDGAKITGYTFTSDGTVTYAPGWTLASIIKVSYVLQMNIHPIDVTKNYIDLTGETIYDEEAAYTMFQVDEKTANEGSANIVAVFPWSLSAYVTHTVSCDAGTKDHYLYTATPIYGNGTTQTVEYDTDFRHQGAVSCERYVLYGPSGATIIHDKLSTDVPTTLSGNKNLTSTTSAAESGDESYYTLEYTRHYRNYTVSITLPSVYDTVAGETHLEIPIENGWEIRRSVVATAQWYGESASTHDKLYSGSTMVLDTAGAYMLSPAAWMADEDEAIALIGASQLVNSDGDVETLSVFDEIWPNIVTTRFL